MESPRVINNGNSERERVRDGGFGAILRPSHLTMEESSNAFLLSHCAKATELKRRSRSPLYLPEEVVEQILLRLSPHSLLTCKRVCKLWYSLIKHPSFIKKHLRFTIDNTNTNTSSSISIFLKWTRQELTIDDIFHGERHDLDLSKQVLSLVTISKDDANSSTGDHIPNCVIEQLTLPPIPEPEQLDFPRNLVSCHCNGIICLFDGWFKDTVVWCNPAVRKFKILRTPHLSCRFESAGHGFGYDLIANDYKYVKIIRSKPEMIASRALVYTLGTDSWREINIDVVQGKCCGLKSKGVYCKGVYYWFYNVIANEMILSFDMSKEEFHTIPIPDHTKDVEFKIKRLALWNESVVFFFSPELSWFSTSLEMWVMLDSCSGVEGSTYWRKHLTIGPLARIALPLDFWKDDELLMETRDGQIVSYNLHTKKLRKLPIPGAIYPRLTYADVCLKSLLLV